MAVKDIFTIANQFRIDPFRMAANATMPLDRDMKTISDMVALQRQLNTNRAMTDALNAQYTQSQIANEELANKMLGDRQLAAAIAWNALNPDGSLRSQEDITSSLLNTQGALTNDRARLAAAEAWRRSQQANAGRTAVVDPAGATQGMARAGLTPNMSMVPRQDGKYDVYQGDKFLATVDSQRAALIASGRGGELAANDLRQADAMSRAEKKSTTSNNAKGSAEDDSSKRQREFLKRMDDYVQSVVRTTKKQPTKAQLENWVMLNAPAYGIDPNDLFEKFSTQPDEQSQQPQQEQPENNQMRIPTVDDIDPNLKATSDAFQLISPEMDTLYPEGMAYLYPDREEYLQALANLSGVA